MVSERQEGYEANGWDGQELDWSQREKGIADPEALGLVVRISVVPSPREGARRAGSQREDSREWAALVEVPTVAHLEFVHRNLGAYESSQAIFSWQKSRLS